MIKFTKVFSVKEKQGDKRHSVNINKNTDESGKKWKILIHYWKSWRKPNKWVVDRFSLYLRSFEVLFFLKDS